jgi:hypothetical protein
MAFFRAVWQMLDSAELPGCGDLCISELATRLSSRLARGLHARQDKLLKPLVSLVPLLENLLPRVAKACRACPREEAMQLMSDLWVALEETYVQSLQNLMFKPS